MKSMTGYGRGTAHLEGSSLTIEIKAVNGKQRDIRSNLPAEFSVAESAFEALLARHIARGSVTVTGAFRPSPELKKTGLCIDNDLAATAVEQLRTTAATAGIAADVTLADLLALPGFVTVQNVRLEAETAETLLLAATTEALEMFNASRQTEGAHLQADLASHCDQLETLLTAMRERQNEVLFRYRDRLLERIRLLDVDLKLDDERLAKEVAFAAQKSDIAEELARLDAHLKTLRQLLADPPDVAAGNKPPAKTPSGVGRQLQFVVQEIHREINTLGSKTSETETAKEVIQFKTALEKIREQIANVE